MAPAAYAIDNMQDVGGLGFQPGDKHALSEDTVDAPLSVAIEKSGKPVKYWEYVFQSRDLSCSWLWSVKDGMYLCIKP